MPHLSGRHFRPQRNRSTCCLWCHLYATCKRVPQCRSKDILSGRYSTAVVRQHQFESQREEKKTRGFQLVLIALRSRRLSKVHPSFVDSFAVVCARDLPREPTDNADERHGRGLLIRRSKMSNLAVKVEEPAYLKLMLHAAKYPWAAVSGFLLGEAGSPATEKVLCGLYVGAEIARLGYLPCADVNRIHHSICSVQKAQ